MAIHVATVCSFENHSSRKQPVVIIKSLDEVDVGDGALLTLRQREQLPVQLGGVSCDTITS